MQPAQAAHNDQLQRPGYWAKCGRALVVAIGVVVTGLLAAGCSSIDPFSGGDEQVGRLADSAARASLQTYGILTRAVQRQERLAEREAQEEQASSSELGTQFAALPPASTPELALRVQFNGEPAALDSAARAELAALSAQLLRSGEVPVRLMAYWSADDDEDAAPAKIQALKRAMLVRDFLTDQGLARAPIEFPRLEEEEDDAPGVIDVLLETR